MEIPLNALQRRPNVALCGIKRSRRRRIHCRRLKCVAHGAVGTHCRSLSRVKTTSISSQKWILRSLLFDSDDYFENEDEFVLTSSRGNEKGAQSGRQPAQQSSTAKSEDRNEDNGNLSRNSRKKRRSNSQTANSWYRTILWLWERPFMKIGRLTVLFAKLPSAITFLSTKIGLLSSQITLPMLPPLLVGGGILLRSVWVNAGYLVPRVSLTIFLLWGIWLLNSLIFRMVGYLTDRGTVNQSAAHTITILTEGLTLATAGLVILSLFGVNISGLLLPAGICVALAAKDVAHNFLAGIVLFLARPFSVGDEVSVKPVNNAHPEMKVAWNGGVCERVDLRYTVLRKGQYKLHVPNSAFVTREFLVLDKSHVQSGQRTETSNSGNKGDTNIRVSFNEKDAESVNEVDVNGAHLDVDDLPSEADYPCGELHLGDLTDWMTDT